MKKIIYIDDLLAHYCPDAANVSLSPERQARAQLLCNNLEKQRFLTAEWLTQQVLSHCFGVSDGQIRGGLSRKPFLKSHSNVCFSRSYCAEGLVIAAEHADSIGVDCEPLQEPDEAVMKQFFTEREQAFVQCASCPQAAFSLIWTRKEAYVKCIGKGLCYPWNQLDVTPAEWDFSCSPLSPANDPVNHFYLNSYLIDNIVISLCTPYDEPFPAVQKWEVR